MSGKYLRRNRVMCFIILAIFCALIFGVRAFILDSPPWTYYLVSMASLILCIIFSIGIPFTTNTGKSSFLICLAFSFMLFYGIFSAFFPVYSASKVLPSNWQWPIAGKTQALVLKSGQKAVVLKGPPRVQIYDANNQYLRGWFVPVVGISGGHPRLIGNGEKIFGPKGQEMILVEVGSDAKYFIFTPDGQIVLEQYFDRFNHNLDTLKTRNFETIKFKSSWYALPLGNPIYAICCAVVGVIGLTILNETGVIDTRVDRSKADTD